MNYRTMNSAKKHNNTYNQPTMLLSIYIKGRKLGKKLNFLQNNTYTHAYIDDKQEFAQTYQ